MVWPFWLLISEAKDGMPRAAKKTDVPSAIAPSSASAPPHMLSRLTHAHTRAFPVSRGACFLLRDDLEREPRFPAIWPKLPCNRTPMARDQTLVRLA
ncbi:hypothetical protein GCM10009127_09080 [Alteraurantiacibacter aestuarii]